MNTNDIQISLPSSKSYSNRWLVCNYLQGDRFVIENLSPCDDTTLLRVLLRQMRRGGDQQCYCHGAGSVVRFLMPLLCQMEGTHLLTGDERLRERPMAELIEALRDMGFDIVCLGEEGALPVRIVGGKQKRKMVTMTPTRSSQFVSAMLLAGAALPLGVTLNLKGRITSRPYIEQTMEVLRTAGVECSATPNGHVYYVSPHAPCLATRSKVVVESDWSAAAYFYLMAALAPDRRLRLRGVSTDSLQADAVADKVFRDLGVQSQTVRSPYRSGMRSLRLQGGGEKTKRLQMNFEDCPDLFPTVAVACAALGVEARLRGLANIRNKESDRVAAIMCELERMGAKIAVKDDEMTIRAAALHGVESVDSHGDHRIAMALAPLRLLFPEMRVERPEVVSKSFPDYWAQLQKVLDNECH